jgi:predicted XRE-type DNA-binding protein
MSKDEKIEVERSSGNVFRDFGHAGADVLQASETLTARIIGVHDDKKLSVRAAHQRTGFAAADFSRIRNADLSCFTIDRLINILGALDEASEVHLNVRKRRKSADAAQHPSL